MFQEKQTQDTHSVGTEECEADHVRREGSYVVLANTISNELAVMVETQNTRLAMSTVMSERRSIDLTFVAHVGDITVSSVSASRHESRRGNSQENIQ
jgi:hypothetical protein